MKVGRCKSCQILFRGSGGPRDYAARRISGAKLSFAFTSVLRFAVTRRISSPLLAWSLPHQFSTFLVTVSRSYFAPIITTPVFNDATQHPYRSSLTVLCRPQLRCSYGGGAGYRTRVLSNFRIASSNIFIYIWNDLECQVLIYIEYCKYNSKTLS